VVQAEIFNRYLSARREHGLGQLLEGEVVRLDKTSSLFVVEDPMREQARLDAGDIHLMGPLLGAKNQLATLRARQIEDGVLSELALERRSLAELGKLAPGGYRDLLIRPDQLHLGTDGTDYVVLSFALASGSYATLVVRELTREPFLAPRPAPQDRSASSALREGI
jgi:tRNA pseudouridine13 synthase